MKKRVIVTFREPALHCWPDAPEETKYLRDAHRHLFHWRVEVSVEHSDRQVEFHRLLDDARGLAKEQSTVNWLSKRQTNFTWSCEMMAEQLIKDLVEIKYNCLAVECWEDGECGARVEV